MLLRKKSQRFKNDKGYNVVNLDGGVYHLNRIGVELVLYKKLYIAIAKINGIVSIIH